MKDFLYSVLAVFVASLIGIGIGVLLAWRG